MTHQETKNQIRSEILPTFPQMHRSEFCNPVVPSSGLGADIKSIHGTMHGPVIPPIPRIEGIEDFDADYEYLVISFVSKRQG
jgi:hypothetical protein